MTSPEKISGGEPDKESLISERTELAKKLEGIESFPFPGIEESAYEKLKLLDAEILEYGLVDPMPTTIDELIRRFKEEGIKVVIIGRVEDGKPKESAMIYPRDIDTSKIMDLIDDAIRPRNLEIVDGMDPDLRRLIELDRI